ncbi:two-component response regulator [alpha proteobacterium U9-1i]|nr:two-component response regulator [alpha proteobacterium U9-1i]
MTKFDPAAMTALVVDPNHFQRRLTLEQLRLMGFGAVTGASNFEQAWAALVADEPHVIIEWVEPRAPALDFVRRVRNPTFSPNTETSLFMLSSNGKLNDVESARAAGIDGYLRKPVSVAAIQDRVRQALVRPKVSQEQAEADLRGQRARALAAALDTRVRGLVLGDAAALREVRANALDLADAAQDVNDQYLVFGARELARYLDACAEGLALDPDAARTHTSALFQIALLPSAFMNEREKLANGLKRMIEKKLSETNAA